MTQIPDTHTNTGKATTPKTRCVGQGDTRCMGESEDGGGEGERHLGQPASAAAGRGLLSLPAFVTTPPRIVEVKRRVVGGGASLLSTYDNASLYYIL